MYFRSDGTLTTSESFCFTRHAYNVLLMIEIIGSTSFRKFLWPQPCLTMRAPSLLTCFASLFLIAKVAVLFPLFTAFTQLRKTLARHARKHFVSIFIASCRLRVIHHWPLHAALLALDPFASSARFKLHFPMNWLVLSTSICNFLAR